MFFRRPTIDSPLKHDEVRDSGAGGRAARGLGAKQAASFWIEQTGGVYKKHS